MLEHELKVKLSLLLESEELLLELLELELGSGVAS